MRERRIRNIGSKRSGREGRVWGGGGGNEDGDVDAVRKGNEGEEW
jgi:hypothetical protein